MQDFWSRGRREHGCRGIGTGFIGGILGRSLAATGHQVIFGSRHPDDDDVAVDSSAVVSSVAAAIAAADAVILAVPGQAVPEFVQSQGAAPSGKLVIDATNRMGEPVANSRAALPPSVRYARAFNTLSGENMADPIFDDGPADMFFSGSPSPTDGPSRQSSRVSVCASFSSARTRRRSSIASSDSGSPLP
jgi:predicted dinucleotide-binding enzyme